MFYFLSIKAKHNMAEEKVCDRRSKRYDTLVRYYANWSASRGKRQRVVTCRGCELILMKLIALWLDGF